MVSRACRRWDRVGCACVFWVCAYNYAPNPNLLGSMESNSPPCHAGVPNEGKFAVMIKSGSQNLRG